jgi:hypothetical protein
VEAVEQDGLGSVGTAGDLSALENSVASLERSLADDEPAWGVEDALDELDDDLETLLTDLG